MSRTDYNRIQDYYAEFDEWNRLTTPAGQIEFERTIGLLEAYLSPQSRILDLGGGPGRYTIALAQKGHQLSLADLSFKLLDIARDKIEACGVAEQVESVEQANAINLSAYADNVYDAVLALGPFYHLTRHSERKKAAAEIVRVLKHDGLLFAAFLPKMSGLAGLIERACHRPNQVSPDTYLDTLQTGRFHNNASDGFQEGYYPTIGEMRDLLDSAGFQSTTIESLRGLASGKEEALLQIKQTHPDLYATILTVIEQTASNESVIDSGGHALFIGRKVR